MWSKSIEMMGPLGCASREGSGDLPRSKYRLAMGRAKN